MQQDTKQQPPQQPPQQLPQQPPGYYQVAVGAPPPQPQQQQPPPAAAYNYPYGQYPPQQMSQQPGAPVGIQPQHPVHVITVTAPIVTYRDIPLSMQCPHCQSAISTELRLENGLLVWLLIGAICIFGAPLFLFLGCCLIPLCIPNLKDVGHFCPACHRKLGTYHRVR